MCPAVREDPVLAFTPWNIPPPHPVSPSFLMLGRGALHRGVRPPRSGACCCECAACRVARGGGAACTRWTLGVSRLCPALCAPGFSSAVGSARPGLLPPRLHPRPLRVLLQAGGWGGPALAPPTLHRPPTRSPRREGHGAPEVLPKEWRRGSGGQLCAQMYKVAHRDRRPWLWGQEGRSITSGDCSASRWGSRGSSRGGGRGRPPTRGQDAPPPCSS